VRRLHPRAPPPRPWTPPEDSCEGYLPLPSGPTKEAAVNRLHELQHAVIAEARRWAQADMARHPDRAPRSSVGRYGRQETVEGGVCRELRATVPPRRVPSRSVPRSERDASPARPTIHPSRASRFALSLRGLVVPRHAGSSPIMAGPGRSGLVDWRLNGWGLSHRPARTSQSSSLNPRLSTSPTATPPGFSRTGCPPVSMRPVWRWDPQTARPATSRPASRTIPDVMPSSERSRSLGPTHCSRPDRTST